MTLDYRTTGTIERITQIEVAQEIENNFVSTKALGIDQISPGLFKANKRKPL